MALVATSPAEKPFTRSSVVCLTAQFSFSQLLGRYRAAKQLLKELYCALYQLKIEGSRNAWLKVVEYFIDFT